MHTKDTKEDTEQERNQSAFRAYPVLRKLFWNSSRPFAVILRGTSAVQANNGLIIDFLTTFVTKHIFPSIKSKTAQ